MTLRRPLLALLGALLCFVTVATAQQKPAWVSVGAVRVELVAHDRSIQPGKPFWVALKIDHEAHWHTYWINPGTGYPTSISWTLPEGFTAGPILWPAPSVVKDTKGTVTGNGYENQTFLFVEITPPATLTPGTDVTLTALVEWLMCKDVCMPGDAALTLTRPVRTETPGPDMTVARLFNNSFAALPQKSAAWAFSAQRSGQKITLNITPRNPADLGNPTELHYFDANAVVDYAAPQVVSLANGTYTLVLSAEASAPDDAAGLRGVLTSKTSFTATEGKALLIDEPFVVREPIKATTATSSGGAEPVVATLAGTLLLAFLGGLVLNLMPCVFPVLGIKIMGFVNQAGSDRAKVVQHGLVFTAGVLASFWALAGLLLALRAGGDQLGWGFQLQSPAFVFAMAAFLLIFAFNLSGLFEVGLSATGAGATLQSKDGLAGSFFTGMLATLVATPCSAPFLAPALGAALTLSAAQSLLVFTAIALGLATPYLLLSIFPQAIKLLPRPGAWMETFKQLMSFPLYATVGWLLWVLAAQTAHDDNALLLIVFSFVLLGMAAWAYGRFGQTYGKPPRQFIGRLAAALLLVGGLWLGWPKSAPAAPVAGATAAYQMVWEKWSPEAVAAAQAAGKFVYVDFTARWCATCQTNKATVFSSDAVLAEFARRNVVLLRGDWTNRDPAITAELARWNRSAVPFNLIYAPGRAEPVLLPELLTGGIVLEKLAEAAR
ncbi:MAG: protein-disulfide reductase DsbD family protein [Candidatus Didemnitutus sp.]|nr:protein-disulfide reductase DsbD family protein [Candidatus Didemnitutus sp.]